MKHLTNAMLQKAWHKLEVTMKGISVDRLNRKLQIQTANVVMTRNEIAEVQKLPQDDVTRAFIRQLTTKLSRQEDAEHITRLMIEKLAADPAQLQIDTSVPKKTK